MISSATSLRLVSLFLLVSLMGCSSFPLMRFEEPRDIYIELYEPVTATLGNGQACFVVPAGELKQVGKTAREGVYEHHSIVTNICREGATGKPGLTMRLRASAEAHRRVVAYHTSIPVERYRVREVPDLSLFQGETEVLRVSPEPVVESAAGGQPFSLKGDVLGQSAAVTLERHPNADCRKAPVDALICTEVDQTFGGSPASRIVYGIYRDQLVSVAIVVAEGADKEVIIEALMAKFGAYSVRPGAPETIVWQNKETRIGLSDGEHGTLDVFYSHRQGQRAYEAARKQHAVDDL